MDYKSALDLLDWDAQTQMPRKGVQGRADARGTLAAEKFHLSVSDRMGQLLDDLADIPNLDPVTTRMATLCRQEFERNIRIPADRFEAYVVLTTKAQTIWQEARQADDFARFAPYLEQMFAFKREFIGYLEHHGHSHPYDALLDEYEPGLTVEALDPLFHELRDQTVGLLQRIAQAPQPDDAFLYRHFEPAKQRQFCEYILGQIGYDFDAGRLDVAAHPFATTIAAGDVRITTRFLPTFLNAALFGSIHECGHALYEQQIAPELAGTNLFEGTSMGIHESQSRFWENTIGRSYAFWKRYYGHLQDVFAKELGDVSLDAFYAAINAVKPSLIRVEADEVTYNLHIMIRYEIEKGLIGGEMKVADLPAIWREKMSEYLGIQPANDRDGVLQDVHWSAGLIGYFPSYALGNLYSAQFTEALKPQVPDFTSAIEQGRFGEIRAWLKDNIHRHGKQKTPQEIVRAVTGKALHADDLLTYFAHKFEPLYGLGRA